MNESILLEALKEIIKMKEHRTSDIYTIATEAIKKWEDSSGKETLQIFYVPICLQKEKPVLDEFDAWDGFVLANDNPELGYFREGKMYDAQSNGYYLEEDKIFWLKPVKLSSLQSVPPYKEEVDKDWEYFWNELMRLQTEKETGVEVIDGLKLQFHLTRKSKDEAVDHEK